MTNHGEKAPNLELLSITEADAYLKAVNIVLGDSEAEIEGLRHTFRTPEESFHKERIWSRFTELTDDFYPHPDGLQFTTRLYMSEYGVELAVSQEFGGDTEDKKHKPHLKEVVSYYRPGTRHLDYRFLESPVGLDDLHDNLSVSDPAEVTDDPDDYHFIDADTPALRQKAQLLFITVATDFKTHLNDKLAENPELIQAIDEQSHQLLAQNRESRDAYLGGTSLGQQK